jgi:MFS family permease
VTQAPPRFDAARRRVIVVCVCAGITTLLDQSVLHIAIPALHTSLHAGTADAQWIVAGYSLAFGLAPVPGAAWAMSTGARVLPARSGRHPLLRPSLAGSAPFALGTSWPGHSSAPRSPPRWC